MPQKVAITGTGVVSSLGDSTKALHSSLCAGTSACDEVVSVNDRELDQRALAAPIGDFSPAKYLGDKNLRPLDRSGRLAASAAQLALDSGDWSSDDRENTEIDLVVGTTFCSAHTITQFDRETQVAGPKYAKPLDFANTVFNAAAGQTAIWHNLRGANTTIAAGKVSGLRALKHAQIQISQGDSSVSLVGAVEEYCFETQTAYSSARQLQESSDNGPPLPFSIYRDGFVLGEGAAFVVLEDFEAAKLRRVEILGELLGHGSSYDVSRGQSEETAVIRCADSIQSALTAAELSANDIDCISCSANGSRREDRFEALALAKVFGNRLEAIPLSVISVGIGETLGASGMFQMVSMLEAMRGSELSGAKGITKQFDEELPRMCIHEGTVTGNFRRGLVLSLGYDGSSAATIVSLPEESNS